MALDRFRRRARTGCNGTPGGSSGTSVAALAWPSSSELPSERWALVAPALAAGASRGLGAAPPADAPRARARKGLAQARRLR